MIDRYLPTDLRRALEKAVKDARIVAEEGARDAIRRLGVAEGKAPSYLNDDEKGLRRQLRAHARALGDAFDRKEDTQEIKRLVESAAYGHWHRMLFARFLAERGLLRNPEHDVAVTLEDCRELAEAEGLTDAWAVAERYAAAMLPAVFQTDDPVLALNIDPVHTQKLNRLVTALDSEVFQAEDSLGWTYQFWRATEKDAVNKSGVKIGAAELPAVTQLFTEAYMVRFLLHNTLGAWWAGKVLAAHPTLVTTAADEEALRSGCSLPGYSFDMLRFVREGDKGPWRPAAGTFDSWPKEAKAITVLDPCCGSGHFLTESLAILTALRQAEEELASADAVSAVLRDNLHGLEIDGRCVQIAAFAVALSAWRIAGWQTLPLPHIAWVGEPPPMPKREFVALGEGSPELEYALAALHDLFAQAPILGSLLEPSGGDLFEAEKLREIERMLEPLLTRARRAEPERHEGVIAARGMADAAALLYRKYVLQATNVPFLGRGRQKETLADYVARHFKDGKADLATAMVSRMQTLCLPGGSLSFVAPQNWLFLGAYKALRQRLLSTCNMNFAAALGTGAFETISGEVVNAALMCFSNESPESSTLFAAIDANKIETAAAKEREIRTGIINLLRQSAQISNPGSTIAVQDVSADHRLGEYAESFAGVCTGDYARFGRNFWEVSNFGDVWELQRTTTDKTMHFGGASQALRWEKDSGSLRDFVQERLGEKNAGSWLRGHRAWGSRGVCVKLMSELPVSIYEGELFDDNVAVLIPQNPEHLGPIYAFCSSAEFSERVRELNQKFAVKTQYLLGAPFDLERWQGSFRKNYPNGLPTPSSDDPTQWFFHGHPVKAEKGVAIHVALARLCGYHWPAETNREMRLSEEARDWVAKTATLPVGDNDGLIGVPAVAGEKPLVNNLRAYLSMAFGTDWSDALERRLIAEADEIIDKKVTRDGSLEVWLRDRAFRQHCTLFNQRPFLWQISDGLKDGFSVFVHYHRFDQANLRKLTYTMLGDWLARAKAENNTLRYEKGRELQQTLEKVLEGEKPYDIFVRWKSLAQQPLGWAPDLDDGVRQNIRPFIKASVLTHNLSKILKGKDRGADVASAPWCPVFRGERRNDHHTTLAEKRAAREAAANRAKAVK